MKNESCRGGSVNTPCMTYSESGQPTGGGPCDGYVSLVSKAARLEGLVAGMEEGNARNKQALTESADQLAKVLVDNGRLRTALLKAVKMYGKPGGPWNVSSEPGEWLAMAKEALGI